MFTDRNKMNPLESSLRVSPWFLVAFTAAILSVQLLTLNRLPRVFVDEPWFCNASWNLAQTGVNFDTMHGGVLDQFGNEAIRRPFLGQIPWTLGFKLVGVGLWQARITSWLLGCILALLTFLLGKRLYDARTASLAAAFLVASPGFISACHYARQDIFLATFGLAAFLTSLSALDRAGWIRHLAAGFIAAISLDIHQNGVVFVIAIATLYLGHFGWSTWKTRAAWSCVAGGVVGGMWFYFVHLWNDFDLYFQLNGFALGNYGVPVVHGVTAVVRSAILEFMRFDFHQDGLLFAICTLSFCFLAIRRQSSDRYLLLYAFGIYAGLALMVGNNTQLYRVLFLPYLFCGGAEALLSVSFQKSDEGQELSARPQWFVLGLTAIVLFYYPLVYANDLRKSLGYDYDAVGNEIRQVVIEASNQPVAETRVMAVPTWWFPLHDFEFRSNHCLAYREWFNEETISASLVFYRPDFLIFDDEWRDDYTIENGQEAKPYQIARERLDEFLQQQATKLTTLQHEVHGKIEIYQVRWPDTPPSSQIP